MSASIRPPDALTLRSAVPAVRLVGCLAAAMALAPGARADGDALPDVVVTAGLRSLPVLEVPTSVAVLDAHTLAQAGQQQLEEVLGQIANLNWAGDTSRPRYFQIRGMGELEQYQGAPNPSVGFLVDDVDFSGLGGVATLFDVDQVEVLRGPQGTRYGANALAGLISVTSRAPAREFGARVELGVANYDASTIGAVLTGPAGAPDTAFRLAVQRYRSDGYYDNLYLHRDDTNAHDEITVRARWRLQRGALRTDLSLLEVRLDNGYDAFAIDNSRNTRSDRPGRDLQSSTGASLRSEYTRGDGSLVTVIAAAGRSRIMYSYDGDWGNPALWAPYLYDYSETQFRDRDTVSAELRLASPKGRSTWLTGAYVLDLSESLKDTSLGLFQTDPTDPSTAYATDTVTVSRYRSRSYALYGEIGHALGARSEWSLGLRGERRTSHYRDENTDLAAGTWQNAYQPAASLWGGNASLSTHPNAQSTLYLALARGYKAGGFNLSPGLLPGQITFAAETDLNVEAGYRAELHDRALTLEADVFYLARRNAQIKSSYQSDPTNPDAFVYYTGNAESGRNHGLEARVDWRAGPHWTLGATLGLLATQFRDFERVGVTGGGTVTRELANAPRWQGAAYAAWHGRAGLFARLDATGMGRYYFDLPPNDTRSGAYGLLHARAGLAHDGWSIALWGRNLLNRDYPVRGFFFSDVPQDFLASPTVNRLYTQLGEPRTVGVTLTVNFATPP